MKKITNLKAVHMNRVLIALALLACIGTTAMAQTYRPLTGTSLFLNSTYPAGGSLQLQANPGANYTLTFPATTPTANAVLSFASTNGTMNFTAPLEIYQFTNGISEFGSNTVKLGGVLTEPTEIFATGTNTLSIGVSGGVSIVVGGTDGSATFLGPVYINATGSYETVIGNTGSTTTISTLAGIVASSSGSFDRVVVATSDGTLDVVTPETVVTAGLNGVAWTLTGNGITASSGALGLAPTGQWMGTTNSNDLRLGTSGLTRMIIGSGGDISMGGALNVSGLMTGTAGLTVSGGAVNLNTGTSSFAVNIGGTGTTTTILGGPLTLNTTGTGNTTIGNATGTTTLLGSNVDINATGTGTTTIGNTGSTTVLSGLAGSVGTSTSGYDRIVIASSDGTLQQASISTVIAAGVSNSAWGLTGNAITSSSGNLGSQPQGQWIGTTNSTDLRLGTNDLTRMIIGSGGDISMGGALNVSGLMTGTAGLTVSGGAVNLNTGTSSFAVNIGGTGTTTTILGGPLTLNTTGTGNTTIGNATGTTTLLGSNVDINATGTGTTTIGNTGSTTVLSGLAGSVGTSTSGYDRIVIASSDGTLQQASISTVIAAGVSNSAWGLTGNSISDPTTQFLGTTSNQPLVVRTNNTEALRISSAGLLLVGTTSGTNTVEVGGTVRATGLVTAEGGLTLTGATNINNSGTSATNIGTGASAGTVTIGRTSGTLTTIGTLGHTGSVTITGTTTINTTGASNTSIGNTNGNFELVSSQLNVNTDGDISDATGNVVIADNLNITGTGTNNIGVATSTTNVVGATNINATGSALTVIGNTGSSVRIGSLATTLNGSLGSNDRIVVSASDGTLSQVDAAAVVGGSSWLLTGNNFTNSAGTLGNAPSGSFLGNTGNASGSELRLVTDNKVRMIVATNGAISMGSTLDVTGLITGSAGVTISGGTASINNNSNNNTNINTGTSTGTVSIGNASSTTDVLGATNINTSGSAATNIGTGSATGTVTLGGTGTQTIAVGNGAGAKTVNIGSSNTTSTTTILSGSGGVNVNASNNQPTNINTGTSSGAVAIGNASSTTTMLGTTNINTTGSAATSVGNTNAALTLTGSSTTITGSVNVSVNLNTTNGTVGTTEYVYIQSAANNITLPAGASGRLLVLKNVSGATRTVTANGAETCDVASLADGASATIVFNGTRWYQIGN